MYISHSFQVAIRDTHTFSENHKLRIGEIASTTPSPGVFRHSCSSLSRSPVSYFGDDVIFFDGVGFGLIQAGCSTWRSGITVCSLLSECSCLEKDAAMAVQGLHSRQAMPPSLTIAISSSPPSSLVQVVALRGGACRAIKGNVKVAHNLTRSPSINSVAVAPRDAAFNGRGSQIVVHGRSGRSAMYGDAETYVLMEPGEDEQFVTAEELQEKLKNWLQEWPGEKPPIDLTKFKNVDEAVQFLVNAVCELDLGGGQGSLQWYEVRMEQE